MKKVAIAGAAGRDFHDFNAAFRHNDRYRVVAFTATQIPNIEGRRYPAALAGPHYPEGIPIISESDLPALIADAIIDEVVFSYSDVSHEHVMHLASLVLASGADFKILGPTRTMLKAKRPVVAVCAVRTGSGKSQTSRYVIRTLQALGFKRIAAVRHPMPYGNLAKQAVQRFATMGDLVSNECTIEEREEYEPYIEMGAVVSAGVDYHAVLRQVEEESDVIVWDGGNNDLPFFKPDVHIVVADPHRAGHELRYHPGEANLRMADIVVVNKVDTADHDSVANLHQNIRSVNASATVVRAASPIIVDRAELIKDRRVLVVEDGPTLTHGEMAYGAGTIAAKFHNASEVVDPRPYAVGTIAETYAKYPHIGPLLPAMGYGDAQIRDLEETINRTPADVVLIATPIDLGRIIDIEAPALRIQYELQEIGRPVIKDFLRARLSI